MFFKYLLPLFLVLTSLCSHAESTAREAQRIQEMRSLAYLANASIMVIYNLDSTPFEPEVIESYDKSFSRLEQLASSHSILAELETIGALAEQLEAIPRDREYIRSVIIPYRLYLLPIFDAFQRIDNELEQQYNELAASVSEPAQQLHSLSIDHGRVMLQYSMLTFTALSYLNIHDPTLELIDRQIQEKFEQLESNTPDLDLGSVKRNYRYLSPKLVQFPRPWVPVRAKFYLNHNIQTLNKAAASYSS